MLQRSRQASLKLTSEGISLSLRKRAVADSSLPKFSANPNYVEVDKEANLEKHLKNQEQNKKVKAKAKHVETRLSKQKFLWNKEKQRNSISKHLVSDKTLRLTKKKGIT
jgi:hypothetical protein